MFLNEMMVCGRICGGVSMQVHGDFSKQVLVLNSCGF